jgi:hypothetical protein
MSFSSSTRSVFSSEASARKGQSKELRTPRALGW